MNERGSVSVFVALLVVVVLAAAGLVYDGGRLMAVRRQAVNAAEAAARAGADAGTLSGGRGFEPLVAERAARDTVAGLGIAGSSVRVEVSPDGEVRVQIVARRRPVFLATFGVGEQSVVGTGQARPEYAP